MFNYKEILEKARIILRAIGNRGYLAYISGESVVNLVLGIDSNSAFLSTNAPLDEVRMLFNGYEVYNIDDFNLAIYYDDVAFIITHFYQEQKDGRKVNCDDLDFYLASCDFSINALAMTQTKKIIDYVGGYKDINKKVLRLTKNRKRKLNNNPIICLEGLRLVSSLGFRGSFKTIRTIRRSKAIKRVPFDKQLEYVGLMLDSKNYQKCLKYLKKTHIYKYMPVFKEEFYDEIRTKEHLSKDLFIVKALVRCKNDRTIKNDDFDKCLSLSTNPDYYKKVIELALREPKGMFSKLDLFNYGKDIAIKANMVNNLLHLTKRKTKKIEKEYDELIIKDTSEIKYYEEDIIRDFRSLSLVGVGDVLEKIKEGILEGTLLNDYYEIKEFVSGYTRIDEASSSLNKKEEKTSFDTISFKQEIDDRAKRIQELETNSLILELEKEAERLSQSAIRGLDIYQDEKEKVYLELKEAYKNILIKNTQKYERLKR